MKTRILILAAVCAAVLSTAGCQSGPIQNPPPPVRMVPAKGANG